MQRSEAKGDGAITLKSCLDMVGDVHAQGQPFVDSGGLPVLFEKP